MFRKKRLNINIRKINCLSNNFKAYINSLKGFDKIIHSTHPQNSLAVHVSK